MAIDVLLADDQDIVRAGLRLILDAEEDVRIVGEVADGSAAVDRARLLRPDIVLMDIEMPVLDGIEATRRLVEEPGGPRVLVLTTFERDDYVAAALQSGASGFLVKSAPPDELVAALRTVAAGESILSPTVTRRLIERFCEFSLVSRRDDLLQPLTEREREVLQLMARGLSNQEIADALLVSVKTVKTHVSSTLMKLELRDRVQAVVFAYETGFIHPGAHDDQAAGLG
jgi:DNA-binding NarL/FixJ family response regulator